MNKSPNEVYGTPWGRDELVLALYLYCQIPFSQTKASNPEVVRLARLLGRTPSSVARKLGNFGAFDPRLAQKGITGLVHSSRADKAVWDEFHEHWDLLVEESSQLLADGNAEPSPPPTTETSHIALTEPVISLPTGPTDQPRVVMTRLYQAFFRRSVLSSYQNCCCFCGIDLPSLLIASHIIPWSANRDTRTSPENGLCLCALHDKAFDRGLVSVTSTCVVVVSPVVKKSRAQFADTAIAAFEGRSIRLPNRFAPRPEYLQWHIDNVFQQQERGQ